MTAADIDATLELARTVAKMNADQEPGEGHIATDLARALISLHSSALAMRRVVEAAERFSPKLNALRRQFPPCDSWFAAATCTAKVEVTRDEWDRMEALRGAIDALLATKEPT